MIYPALAQMKISLEPSTIEVGTGLLENPFIVLSLYILASIGVLLFLIFIIRKFFISGSKIFSSFQKVVLLITVPKEQGSKEEPQKETKDLISQVENLFAVLGGLRAQRGFEVFLAGRQDHFSFEIVASRDGLISFYVAIPRYLQRFAEQQIHAQYPNAYIEEVEDYNIFSPQGVIRGAALSLKRNYIFPIKTYAKINGDPLNALTNALSKLEKGEGACIQIVARSAYAIWHKKGAKVASEMQQGKRLKEVLRKVEGGIFLNFLWNMFPAKPKKTKEGFPQPQKEIYQLSPMEQEIVKSLEEKTSKAGFDVCIRIITSGKTEEIAERNLSVILNSFSGYSTYEYGNSFKVKRLGKNVKLINNFIYRHFDEKRKFILNTEEMASLWHLPLPTTETPNIKWLQAKKAPAPTDVPKEGLLLGTNVYRGVETPIRIKKDDRRRHVYIIGKSGVGKSWLIQNLVRQDIQNGEGVCVIDPHGDLVEGILESIPKERADDVVIFDPSDMARPVGLNMLEAKTEEEKDFAVQEMISIFYKLFSAEMIGPMFEHNMRNVMLTLMADSVNPGTIAEIPRMFTDTEFQNYWIEKLTDPVVKTFWEKEMAKTSDFHKSEMLGYLISKVGRFVENEMMRNIIGQTHSGFNFRDIMDNKKILLINLAKGKTGEVNSNLLGLIIVSKLQMAAMARAELPEEKRHDFYLYIDEFQNFITPSIGTILSEARKYRLNLIIAHQYIGQLVVGNDTKIRDAVFGNAGTMISFKIGVEDAEIMAKEFAPVFNEYDVINVERYNAYVKLLIDNQATRAFNIRALPVERGNPEFAKSIKELSRLKYGQDRKIVEEDILRRTRLGEPEARQAGAIGERNL
ncbi:MAG: hypothetical protein COX43_03520 [Parcubacteria group bacterium CG23_combo_of_CG06-09_8_20_14_all_35_9]|nr:MAG: hypothetical protein COX43_03520 [Parcubacteria group bacterium CG23_combo_of_CG06-09_8_20_14_all_35_9]